MLIVDNYSAASAAQTARAMIAAGPVKSTELWRYVITQLLDDYESANREAELSVASLFFTKVPDRTGHDGLDIAFAALAATLAGGDEWDAPAWMFDPSRNAEPFWLFVRRSSHVAGRWHSPLRSFVAVMSLSPEKR